MAPIFPPYRSRGFTVVELLVIICVVIAVISFLLPTLTVTHHDSASRKCAANLHNIGIAMITYSNEFGQNFPRTYYDPGSPLDCTNTGGPSNPGIKTSASFGPLSNVPNNSITASIFLLAKTEQLGSAVFVCPGPGSSAMPGFAMNRMEDFANFEDGNPWGQSVSYSFSCMFPGPNAIANGWRWSNAINDPANFAIVADMNPGIGSGPKLLRNNVTNVTHSSSQKYMMQGNSNNHGNSGQQVLYADGHVQFQTTPFCGSVVVPTSGPNFADNIYTARGAVNSETGTIGPTVFPLDAADSYLLPTDDNSGF